MLKIFKGSNGKYGLKNCGKVVVEAFADVIYDDGTFEIGKKWGVIDLQTGKILKEAFADWIDWDGVFGVGGKCGVVDLQTGIITEEAV